MKNAVIVSGGNINTDFALRFLEKNTDENTSLIAADRGLEFFERTGLVPDLAVGDFDSLSENGKKFLQTLRNTEIIKLRPEKDDSDTQSAACAAMDRGAEKIIILGATGNRVDHLLANFGLLVLGKERGCRIILADPWNYIRLIESGTVLKRWEQFGKYVSFFSIGGDVPGLTLKGFKYPLNRHYLTASDSGLTVSNEIVEEEAVVEFEKGILLMLMTRD
ncbi:thiamine diphosphokinase [Blautia sp. XA-2221]|uniref:thiamine diphosphokinase n=1 Tax=Blautia sp. XA-2221 TaxID=2903961 RepID=UPI002379CF9A|nr:thiamine diphosphokinase [Blautia sp. XA-2221]